MLHFAFGYLNVVFLTVCQGPKIDEKVQGKKSILPRKRKFFFALKSFLNDFKAILRVIFFSRTFWWLEICLGKNEKFGKTL